MRIVVAGGTGDIGRMVVEAVRERGDTPVVAARSAGVDLTTGAGVATALDGADAVIDVTNRQTQSRTKSVAFFGAVTSHLLSAHVPHLVALSIVGCDRVPLGYYAGKTRQEELVLASPTGTVLRATQFHEFAGQWLANSFGPFLPAPMMRSQPVAAREVARHLAELAAGPPLGRAPDMGGPEVLEMVPLIRRVARRRGVRKLIVPIRVPGAAGRAMRGGALVATGAGPRGTQTFDEWLG